VFTVLLAIRWGFSSWVTRKALSAIANKASLRVAFLCR
jgi:hypothetical protein